MKKYFIILCLAVAVALTPVDSANAKYHRGDRIVAAAIGGAVMGLVGAAMVHNLDQPTYTYPAHTYVEPIPFIVHETVALWEPHHYRPVRRVRHHHHRRY